MFNSSIHAPTPVRSGTSYQIAQLLLDATEATATANNCSVPVVFPLDNPDTLLERLTAQSRSVEELAARILKLPGQHAWWALASRSQEAVSMVKLFHAGGRQACKRLGGTVRGISVLRRVRSQTTELMRVLNRLEDQLPTLVLGGVGAHERGVSAAVEAGSEQLRELQARLDSLFHSLSNQIECSSRAFRGIPDTVTRAQFEKLNCRFENLISRAHVLEWNILQESGEETLRGSLDLIHDRLWKAHADLSQCMVTPRNRRAFRALVGEGGSIGILRDQIVSCSQRWCARSSGNDTLGRKFTEILMSLSAPLGSA